MTFSEGNQRLCDICYDCECLAVASDFQDNDTNHQFKVEASRLFPGCEGSLILNKHLRVYFIMTKLFKIPSSQFLKQLLKSSPLSEAELRKTGKNKSLKDRKSLGGGNSERLLYTNICTNCEQIVNEAFDLFQKAVTLQHKIDKLGATLFELKEIGLLKKRKEDGEKKELPSKADEMMNLSLACLGGDVIKSADRSGISIKSIKVALRKRKRSIKTRSSKISEDIETSRLEHDPVESAVSINELGSFAKSPLPATENKVSVKKELPETVDDEFFPDNFENGWISDNSIDDKMDTMETTQQEADDNVDNVEDDDPDNDEDYVPTQSTDEDEDIAEDDADDELYVSKKGKKEKNDNQCKRNSSSYVAMDSSDDVFEEVVAFGGGHNTVREHIDFNPIEEKLAAEATATAYEFQCPECSRVFHLRSCLRTHTKQVHGFETHYSCPKCPDLKFAMKKDLVEHRNEVHGNVCQKCGKKLSKIAALVEHYKRVHKIKFTFTCPLCKTGFKTRIELKKHRSMAHIPSKEEIKMLPRTVRPETEEERMWAGNPCSECGKAFLAGEKLDTHLLTQHEYKMTKAQKLAEGKRCYFCWKYLTLEQRHWIHRKMAHPDKQLQFPCEQCTDKNMVFQTASELLVHFQTDHAEDSVYTCPLCRWPFLNELSLNIHRKVHVNKKPDPDVTDAQKMGVCKFNCWFCWELFPTEEKLQRHFISSTRHRKNFKFEFPCDDYECDRSVTPFASANELRNHFTEAHSERKVFTCDRCNWSFLSSDMLKLHKINHIPRRACQYKCPDCEHISAILTALRDHYNRYHGLRLKIHKCVDCHERFETKKAVTLHQIQMHDKYSEELRNGFPCDKCGKMFRSEKAVKGHQIQNHANLKCPDCEMPFQQSHKLKLHRQKVHGFGERYLCTVCGNECLDKALLIKHMERHNEVWFECHLCGLKMKDENLLKKHVKKKHENEKPKPNQKFVCKICGRGYSRKDSLDDHIRVNHTQDSHRVWECGMCGKRFKRQTCLAQHKASATACRTRHTLLDGADKTSSSSQTKSEVGG